MIELWCSTPAAFHTETCRKQYFQYAVEGELESGDTILVELDEENNKLVFTKSKSKR